MGCGISARLANPHQHFGLRNVNEQDHVCPSTWAEAQVAVCEQCRAATEILQCLSASWLRLLLDVESENVKPVQ
jgi:hypothetical protein